MYTVDASNPMRIRVKVSERLFDEIEKAIPMVLDRGDSKWLKHMNRVAMLRGKAA